LNEPVVKSPCEETCLKMRKEILLFRYFGESELAEAACYFSFRRVNAGDALWNEGDSCDYIAFIASGEVETKKETEFEGRHVMVGTFGKGAVIGVLCVLDNAPRAVTAVAREDTVLVVLTRENIDKLIREHPSLGIELLKGMLLAVSVRLRKSFDRLTTMF
jgi:CRP/FNR family cyclic AMP-dependent transcriptional regulator